MSLSWTDKVNNVDDIDASDVNALAAAIVELEQNKVDKSSTGNSGLSVVKDAYFANYLDSDGNHLPEIALQIETQLGTIRKSVFYPKDAMDTFLAKKTDKPTLSDDTLEITINTDVKDVNVPTVTGMDSEIASLRTSIVGSLETLNNSKVDKADGMGLSQVKKIQESTYVSSDDTVPQRKRFDFTLQDDTKKRIEYYSCETTNDLLAKKSDQTTYYNPTTGSAIPYDLKNEHNRMTSYISADAATSVAISVSDGAYRNDYISGLSFYTGSTPPEVSYPSSPYTMRWVGSECVTSGESSVFSPIANRVYDIIFYFNGGYIVGLVNGYDDIA